MIHLKIAKSLFSSSGLLIGLIVAGTVMAPKLVGAGIGQIRGLSSDLDFSQSIATTFEIDTREIILESIQKTAKLQSAEANFDFFVPARAVREVWGVEVGSIDIKYQASGVAVAGIDLSQLAKDDVRIEDGRTILTLPPAQLLSSYVDVSDQTVVAESRSFLGPDQGARLLAEAQRQSQLKMIDLACESDLLDRATESAKASLEGLVDQVVTSAPVCELEGI